MNQHDQIVASIAAAAAVVAATSNVAPTGIETWDRFLAAVLAALFVVALSKAPRWVAIVATTAASTFVGWSPWLVVAVLGLTLTIWSIYDPRRNRVVGAIAGALSIQALLRLPPLFFFGFPSLVTAIVVILGAVFAYKYSTRSSRRIIRFVSGVLAMVLATVAAIGTVGILSARTDAERGISAARAGLAAAQRGDPEVVAAELGFAESALVSASEELSSRWLAPLKLIPGVAYNHRALADGAAQGAEIASTAGSLNRVADLDSMELTADGIDLSLLSSLAPGLATTVEKIDTALVTIQGSRSPWIIPPIDGALDDLVDEIGEVLPDARLAADAAREVPQLLGAEGERRYLVAFGTPGESREFGGLLGSWAMLSMNNGRATFVDSGRIGRLYDIARANPFNPADYPQWYLESSRPNVWPQNLTGSPSPEVFGRATREILNGAAGGSFDGIVYLDALAMIDLLELTGPIPVPWSEEPLTTDNAAEFFFRDQYLLSGTRTETFEELSLVIESILQELRTMQLPGPERLGAILGPAARAGHIQVLTFDPDEIAFLESVKLYRSFERPADIPDAFALVQSNGTATKLDIHLQREVWYDVTVDDVGVLTGTMRVDLTNNVPEDAPAYVLGRRSPGDNIVLLSLYTPHQLVEIVHNGQPLQNAATREFGYWRYLVEVPVPRNSVQRLDLSLVGRVPVDQPYALSVWQQALVNPDEVHVTYADVDGVQAAFDLTLEETVVLSVDAGSS